MVVKLEDFISANKNFVLLEKQAENEENRILIETHTLNELCKAGVAVKKLKAVRRRTSFGGKFEIKFASSRVTNVEEPLPSHKLSPGDIVNLCQSGNHLVKLHSGVVCKLAERAISVSFDSWNENEMQSEKRTFSLIQTVNDVTFRRWQKTLDLLADYENYPGRYLVDYLFDRSPFPSPKLDDLFINCFDNNPAASEAVRFCVNDSRPVTIIHGPPGTGKTTTLIEIIRISVKAGLKILACAPSNVAVDNIVERLIDAQVRVVRVGHPARTHLNLRRYCLDHVMKSSDQGQLISDIRNELDLLSKNRHLRKEKPQERKALKKELENRENAALRQTISDAQVLCSTLTAATADGPLKVFLEKHHFDLVVIDECAQATELACWSPLLWAKRCVLAGDHNQLAPTIISDKASKEGFSKSIMRRLVDEFPKLDLVRLLTVQYRMNSTIMNWASLQMYDNKLKAHDSVKNHLLTDLPGVEKSEETCCPFMVIDTSDCDMDEIKIVDDESKANIGEVKLAYLHISRLIENGVKPCDIAAISPYNLQVQLMRLYIGGAFPGLSVRSVDGFQGQEREAVVISLVRSNKKGEVGFLKDRKRINVAATRARRHLAVICDSNCVNSDSFIKSLVDYANSFGIVKSALEYEDFISTRIPFEIEMDLPLQLSTTNKFEITKEKPKKVVSAETPSKVSTFNEKLSKNNNVHNVSGQKLPTDHGTDLFEEEIWRENLKFELEQFVEDVSIFLLEFPTTLQSFERKFVHEFAETRNLLHYSSGEGDRRRIVVKKPPQVDHNSNLNDSMKEETVALANVEKAGNLNSMKPKKSATSKNLLQENASKVAMATDLNDDQLMEISAKEESRCKFPKCKQSIMTLGLECKFCNRKFCFTHGMPEIHGCGEEAKREAKAEFRSNFFGGSQKPPARTNDDQRKAALKEKLDNRIKKAQNTRAKGGTKK